MDYPYLQDRTSKEYYDYDLNVCMRFAHTPEDSDMEPGTPEYNWEFAVGAVL
jgi:hypothetical protein